MVLKTEGIVLGSSKYLESSIIVRMYTRDFGLKSFIVNGVRQEKAKLSMGLFQPLSVLQIEMYWKKGAELNRLKEQRMLLTYQHLPFEMRKMSIAMFLTEFLSKALKEDQANQQFYDFMKASLEYLDLQQKGVENFHLYFMLKSAHFLGIGISGPEVIEDSLMRKLPSALHLAIRQALHADYSQPLALLGPERVLLLRTLCDFYAYHQEGFGQMLSIDVLSSVLHA